MSRKRKNNTQATRLQKRNDLIRDNFSSLTKKKYKGGKEGIYNHDAIIEMLSEKYHLSERTIEDIIYHRVKYEEGS